MDGDGLVERTSALWSHLRDVGVRSQGGMINWVSPSVVDVLGYSPEDLVGCTAADITHPDDLAGAMRTRALLVELGVSQLRARVRHKDGSYRWMDIRARTEPDEQGADVMLSSWRDVTDDVAALEAVARNRDELRLVAEHASDVVVRGSDEGRIEWVSPSVRLVLGYDPARLVGVLFVALVHEDDRTVIRSAERTLRAGERAVFEARIATAAGGWRWFAVRVEPVADVDGHRWGVASWRDIDAEVRERVGRVRAGAGLETTLHALVDPHVVLAPVRADAGSVTDFVVADVNEAAAEYIRRPRSELIGARLLDVLPGQATSGLLDRYRAVLDTGVPLRLDGFEYDHEVHGRRRFDVSAVRVGDSIAYTFRDVTDRVEAAERTAALEQRYRALAENVPDIVLRVRDGAFEYVSPSVTSSLGWRPQDLVGKLTYDVIHPDDFALVLRQRANLALLEGPVRFRMRVLDAGGSYHWVEAHGDTRVGVDAEPGVYTGTWRLIDDQVAAEAEMRRRGSTDALTGLVNRQGVLDHLAEVTARPGRSGAEIALIYADVDGFKRVNDTHGHQVGDRVLDEVAQRIVAAVRHGDVVARLGGDELLIVLLGVTTLGAAAAVAEKVRAAVRTVRPWDADVGRLTISFGATLFAPHEAVAAAIDRADRAMYAAKRAGGDGVRTLPPPDA